MGSQATLEVSVAWRRGGPACAWVADACPPRRQGGRELDALVACAQAGDRQAFREVAETLGPPLVRYLTHYLRGDAHTAHDVVQETLVAAWRKIGTIRGGDHMRPWLYRVARCKAISWMRRRGPQGTPMDSLDYAHEQGYEVPDPSDPDPHARPEPPPLGALQAAVERLPPIYAGAVRLHYLCGYSTRETARLLGVPRTAVKMRLHRARKRLRDLMDEFRADA